MGAFRAWSPMRLPWLRASEAGPASDMSSGVEDLVSLSDPFWGSYQRAEVPGRRDFVLLNLLFPQSASIQ